MRESDKLLQVLERNNNTSKQAGPKIKEGKYTREQELAAERYHNRMVDTRNVFNAPLENLALYSKAIQDKLNEDESVKNKTTSERYLIRNRGILKQLHDQRVAAKQSNRNILAMFPDVGMALDIIITTMTSPHKLTETELVYGLAKEVLPGKEALRSSIIEEIKLDIEKEYRLTETLAEKLNKALGVDGCCPEIFIGENIVDEVVNSDIHANIALESYRESVDKMMTNIAGNVGYLNDVDIGKIATEGTPEHEFIQALINKDNFAITDNTSILKLPGIVDKHRTSFIKKIQRSGREFALEANSRLDYLNLKHHMPGTKRPELSGEYKELDYHDLFRNKGTPPERPVMTLPERQAATRKSIGRPMHVNVPAESVIPVFTPGNKDNHRGYVVLLDETGSPLTALASSGGFDDLNNSLHDQGGVMGSMGTASGAINTAYRDYLGNDNPRCKDIRELYSIYRNVALGKLREAMNGSMMGEHLEMSDNEHIMFILFCRSLQDQKTTMLYVPKENMSYFSLYNDEFGMGRTLVEDIKTVCGFSSVILFAEVMAFTKQAINVTDVDITLDEMDPDPEKRLQEFQSMILSTAAGNLPLWLDDPQALSNWIVSAGYRFNVTNLPGFPQMQVEYRNSPADHTLPDSELKEEFKKARIIGLGVTPEIVDEGFSGEFAITRIINNAFLLRRIKAHQKLANVETTNYVRIVIRVDEVLREKLRVLLRGHMTEIVNALDPADPMRALHTYSEEDFLETYIDYIGENVTCELPKISDTTVDITNQEYQDFRDRIDAALNDILSPDLFTPELIGETGEKLPPVKTAFMTTLLRQWASENNYLPEVFRLIEENETEEATTLGSIQNHIGSVMNKTIKMIETVNTLRKAGDTDITNLNNQVGGGDDGYGSGGSMFDSSDDDDDDDGDDGDGGDDLDDFDLDDF